MITYKNITDVEVVNEIPENATALINDGGELKQVACEQFGGKNQNNNKLIVHYSDDNITANLTYDEFLQALTNMEICEGHLINFWTNGSSGFHDFFSLYRAEISEGNDIIMYFQNDADMQYKIAWTTDNQLIEIADAPI